MSVPLLDLSYQNSPLLAELREAFDEAVNTSRFVLGSVVEGFERQLAGYCNASHAVGLSSGTDALLAALMALEIGPGDEVITTPFTFFATVGCIARLGATPVFVDIDPVSFNIDASSIESAITGKTKAIIPVHLFGQAADMAPILRVARDRDVKVIEDAAQAIGARDGDRLVGSIGDVGCLSFYPTKNLSAFGDAGACVTQDAEFAERIVSLRNHGQDAKYHHAWVGGNFRIDALQAAILAVKLRHLDGWTATRREAAGRYHQLLKDLPAVLPEAPSDKFHVYNQYTVRVPDDRRNALSDHLRAKGIGHEIYYPSSLHTQPCFVYLGAKEGDFPVAEQATREVISLPIYPGLTESQQEEVAAAICSFYRL